MFFISQTFLYHPHKWAINDATSKPITLNTGSAFWGGQKQEYMIMLLLHDCMKLKCINLTWGFKVVLHKSIGDVPTSTVQLYRWYQYEVPELPQSGTASLSEDTSALTLLSSVQQITLNTSGVVFKNHPTCIIRRKHIDLCALSVDKGDSSTWRRASGQVGLRRRCRYEKQACI